jgi:hypothetical protein
MSENHLYSGQFSLQRSSSPPLPAREEPKFYYYGLPSQPRLVARTTTTPWEASVVAELRPIGDHMALNEAWQNDFPKKLFDLLGELEIDWTSVGGHPPALVNRTQLFFSHFSALHRTGVSFGRKGC